MVQTPYEEDEFANAQNQVRNKQRFRRRPKQAADLLSRLMARKGYSQVDSQQELVSAWNEIIGQTLRDKTQIAQVRGGVLEIIVTSSAVHQQLVFKKSDLLKKLQTRWSQKIKDLRFKVGPVA